MKIDLLEILACPVCKASLKLETSSEDGLDVIEGTLICDSCPEKYPIEEGIPNLLPPNLRDGTGD
ncbi:MAG: methytransferase partner Trm112 [Chloroflexota bacterium]|nr:methytransferase partner Trm112 [Chloroflexota bacterium]